MIETITFAIAIAGIALLLILFTRIRTMSAEQKLDKHRSRDAGLADLLNYAAVVDDGIIVCKNGSFMASWLYKGDDNASSTDEQREMVSFRINQAFIDKGNGWMIHVDAVRRPAPNYSSRELSEFPDPVSAAIDEERRQLFESLGTMYEGYFVITLTWFPPLLAQRKFVELMFDDDAKETNVKSQSHVLIDQFKRDVSSFENRVSSVLQMTRLCAHNDVNEDGSITTYDDFLSWLQYCITGNSHPVVLPSNPMYMDSYIGGQEMWGGVVPRIGSKYIQVVSIEGFPLQCHPGILSDLAELPMEYRWSSRFIFMDTQESLKHIEKYRKKWKQKVRGFTDQVFNTNSGSVDQDAVDMVKDAEETKAEINSGLVNAGYFTSVVVLMNEDRGLLERYANQVAKAINNRGFAARVETINTLDAYFGSLPGHGVENVRRPILNSLNLADLLPTSSIWTGHANCPCPMYPPNSPALMHCVMNGSTPFRLNLHVRDLGHTFMFGPTSAGKSTHLGIIAAQFLRYPEMSIFNFDKGMSMYPLTKGVGGLHFSVGADDSRLSFCPLQYLESMSDRAWAIDWIDTILALNGIATTPQQRNEISHAIQSMHDSGARTLSEFSLTIQDVSIREAIQQYTVDGSMGHLLDADSDGLSLAKFTTFEIDELMNLGEKYALPVLLYLFRRIERSLQGRPAAIILDEAWLMLAHPAFREKIVEWLKVLRKANCLVLMATQSLSDVEKSGILDVVMESTATKIFLPNVHAHDEDNTALYRRMGLNARQISIVARAIPKREYYYVSESGRRLYDLALGPIALSFVGATDKDSLAEIKRLEDEHGDRWVHIWLAKRNLNLQSYLEAA